MAIGIRDEHEELRASVRRWAEAAWRGRGRPDSPRRRGRRAPAVLGGSRRPGDSWRSMCPRNSAGRARAGRAGRRGRGARARCGGRPVGHRRRSSPAVVAADGGAGLAKAILPGAGRRLVDRLTGGADGGPRRITRRAGRPRPAGPEPRRLAGRRRRAPAAACTGRWSPTCWPRGGGRRDPLGRARAGPTRDRGGQLPSFDPTRPLAPWTLDGATVAPGAGARRTRTGAVRDLALVVLSAEAVGGARWCRRDRSRARPDPRAVRPARSGSSRGSSTGWPTCWSRSSRGWPPPGTPPVGAARPKGAGRRLGRGDRTRGAWPCSWPPPSPSTATSSAAKGAIQVLGGMGFTWEHDAHVHLRRATTLRQLVGRNRAAPGRVGPSGAGRWRRRQLSIDLPPEAEALRAELDARGGRSSPPWRTRRAQRRALADRGLLAPHWPTPWGRDAGAVEQLVIDQVCAEAGAPATRPWPWPPGPSRRSWPTAPPSRPNGGSGPTLRGDVIWCQLFSEPGAGSDLAALSTRATRVDGGWSLTGQKVWTSVAAACPHGDLPGPHQSRRAEAPRASPTSWSTCGQPGIEVRPLREITGDALFNEVFFDGCFVPDDCVVGEIDGGWRLARTTLANERVSLSSDSAFGGALEGVLSPGDSAPRAPRPGHPRPARRACWPMRSPSRNWACGRRCARWVGSSPGPSRASEAARRRVRPAGPRVRTRPLRARGGRR